MKSERSLQNQQDSVTEKTIDYSLSTVEICANVTTSALDYLPSRLIVGGIFYLINFAKHCALHQFKNDPDKITNATINTLADGIISIVIPLPVAIISKIAHETSRPVIDGIESGKIPLFNPIIREAIANDRTGVMQVWLSEEESGIMPEVYGQAKVFQCIDEAGRYLADLLKKVIISCEKPSKSHPSETEIESTVHCVPTDLGDVSDDSEIVSKSDAEDLQKKSLEKTSTEYSSHFFYNKKIINLKKSLH